jgi:uncharacterized protein
MTIADEIKAIEDEIAKTKYNKATQFHIGKLKAKMAKLREDQEKHAAKGGGGGVAFDIKKSGNASVGLVGLPSVGKSTLLNKLTGTESEVASYHFTTLTVIPGLLEYRGAKIQILDMPGIIQGAARGKGRGKEVLSVARSVDLIMLVVDATSPAGLQFVLRELYDANVRLNQRRPDLVVFRNDRGGIQVRSTVALTKVDPDYIKAIAREFKIVNADIVVRQDLTSEEVVDAFAGNRVYNKAFVVVNKMDAVAPAVLQATVRELEGLGFKVLPVSAKNGLNVEELKELLFEQLRFIRVYLRPQGGEADLKEPLVVKEGTDVGLVCDTLHRDFRGRFRWANVWGKSAKFPGQTVGIDHVLQDEDIVTLVLRRGGT